MQPLSDSTNLLVENSEPIWLIPVIGLSIVLIIAIVSKDYLTIKMVGIRILTYLNMFTGPTGLNSTNQGTPIGNVLDKEKASYPTPFLPAFTSSDSRAQEKSMLHKKNFPLIRKFFGIGNKIKFLEERYKFASSFENKMDLAYGYIDYQHYDKAISLFHESIEGLYDEELVVWDGLVLIYELKGELELEKDTLLEIRRRIPNKFSEYHGLRLGRIYEELGGIQNALEEYKRIKSKFPGEEANCRYGLLLYQMNELENAKNVFEEILLKISVSPYYYKRSQKEWKRIAKDKLKDIKKINGIS